MSNKKRLALILAIAIACLSAPFWVMLHPSATYALSGSRLFVVAVLVLCLTPIYPLYRRARNHPRSMAAPIVLVAAMICTFVSVSASSVFHWDSPWITAASYLCTGLLTSACVLFIWNGLLKRE